MKAEKLENRSKHEPAAGSCVLLDHLFCGFVCFVLFFGLFVSLVYYERGHYHKKERERARKK